MGCCNTRDPNNVNLDFSKTHQFEMVCEIKAKDESKVKDMLDQGFGINFKMSKFNGCTILHKAIEFDALNILQMIFNRNVKIDLEAQDSGGLTPLFYAVKGQRWEIMHKLIKKGANVNHKTKYETKLEDCLPVAEKQRNKYLQELKLLGYIAKENSNAQRDIEDSLFDDTTA